MLLLTPLVLHSPKPVEDVIDGGILFSSVILNDSIKLYIYTHVAYTQTHTQTKWFCVRVCYRCRCMGAFNVLFGWLAGWLADCVGFLLTVSLQCTPNTTHKNETRNPNERENMYEWKVNNHRNIIEIWILASNSLDANVYIQFSTYVY